MRIVTTGICIILYSCLTTAAVAKQPKSVSQGIVNGTLLKDTKGNPINAHGGGFLKVGSYFYWIGENRRDGALISCYRSKDLVSWEFRGDLLTRYSNPELADANLERPKVIFNDKTKQFVMWMHYEKSTDYGYARAAVATSSDIDKPFTYIRSFRPLDNMSRDCNLFKDDDGSAYFVSSTRENRDMNIYELTDDYLDIKAKVQTLWVDAQREAPAIVKRGSYYFMVTSFCTGWEPNQGKYAFAKSIKGQWSPLRKFGSPTTYDTQPNFIIPVQGKKETCFIYVGDRWDPSHYFNSSYVFLPMTFPNDTTLAVSWARTVTPDVKKGQIATTAIAPAQIRIKSVSTGGYLAASRLSGTASVASYKLDYAANDMRWAVESVGEGKVRLKHISTGKYLMATDDSKVSLAEEAKGDATVWIQLEQYDGYCKFINLMSSQVLCIDRKGEGSEFTIFTTTYAKDSKEWFGNQLFLPASIYE